MAIKLSRRQWLILGSILAAVILVIFAIFFPIYYINYIKPFNQTVITVDNTEISMRYFLDRARLAGTDPYSMLDTLTDELVIKIMAPQYGIQVADDDIDDYTRYQASGGTGEISDVEFEEWYRQMLNDYDISDSLYRDIVYTTLLASRLQSYLAEMMPTVAEQVHLHIIVVTDSEEAQAAKARLDAGEDFATVAREVSIDSSAGENGGDQGWVPTVLLSSEYQSWIIALDINEVSAVLPYYSSSSQSSSSSSSAPSAYCIFMVSEKDSARELSEENLQAVKSMALDLWLQIEIPNHEVRYYGLYGGGFDDKTYTWINWQLAKESD